MVSNNDPHGDHRVDGIKRKRGRPRKAVAVAQPSPPPARGVHPRAVPDGTQKGISEFQIKNNELPTPNPAPSITATGSIPSPDTPHIVSDSVVPSISSHAIFSPQFSNNVGDVVSSGPISTTSDIVDDSSFVSKHKGGIPPADGRVHWISGGKETIITSRSQAITSPSQDVSESLTEIPPHNISAEGKVKEIVDDLFRYPGCLVCAADPQPYPTGPMPKKDRKAYWDKHRHYPAPFIEHKPLKSWNAKSRVPQPPPLPPGQRKDLIALEMRKKYKAWERRWLPVIKKEATEARRQRIKDQEARVILQKEKHKLEVREALKKLRPESDQLLGGAYAMGREGLRAFSILTDRDYRPTWLHDTIAAKLEAVERGEIKRLIIEVPPRHGKSQLATINFPAWYLGRDAKREVIVCSYNAELAQDFGSKTRDLVSSAEYHAIFPKMSLRPDSMSKAKWATQNKGSYTSVGVGGALTGRGSSLLIVDDPLKNREEAESDIARASVWNWYTSTARTRLEKNGAVIVIMTRWHLFDLVGQLLENEANGGEKWERITFPAIATQDEAFRKTGEALWPEKYDLHALNELQNSIGNRDWLALFQQAPIMSETADFKQEFFKHYEESQRPQNLVYYTGVDLAISSKDSADNVVVRTIGKERDKPDIWLIEEHAGHFDPLQTIELIFLHVARYHPMRVGVESVAYQKALSHFLLEEQRRKGVFFDVVDVPAKGDKEMRLRGLVPMYKAGIIHHRSSDKLLEQELLQFPQGKHDDRIDALNMAIGLTAPTTYSGGQAQQRFSSSTFAYRRTTVRPSSPI